MNAEARRIVERFELTPHPEGGFFREVWRSAHAVQHPGVATRHAMRRRAGSMIYFLLAEEQFSAFHRVRWTDEIWHLYAGAGLELHLLHADGSYEQRFLTGDLEQGEPATVVEAGCWQAARVPGGSGYAFGGCTVAPGFEYEDFEMPPARDLIAAYPAHQAVIRALTRA